MKKVRIMLAAMIVLGSVGGALALKAKKFGTDKYCYSTTTNLNGNPTCTISLEQAKFDPPVGVVSAYITTVNPVLCTIDRPLCVKTGHPIQ